MATFLFLAGLLVSFFVGFLAHLGDGFNGSWWFCVAKGGGFMLNYSMALVTLPMLRHLTGAMRQSPRLKTFVPDENVYWHKLIAFFGIGYGTLLHSIGHLVHTIEIQAQNKYWWDDWDYIYPKSIWHRYSGQSLFYFFYRYGVFGAAPLTGIVLLFIMGAISVTGHDRFRRRHWSCPTFLSCACCNCCACDFIPDSLVCKRRKIYDPASGTEELEKFPRACGGCVSVDGYQVFWIFHSKKLLVFTYVLTILHAPSRFLIWIFFPALVVFAEFIVSKKMEHRHAILLRAEYAPGDVLTLFFKIPPGFVYQAGQYAEIFWRNERHPFTICSAPEEGIVAFSIKSGDNLDWCSALRKRLIDYPLKLELGPKELSSSPGAGAGGTTTAGAAVDGKTGGNMSRSVSKVEIDYKKQDLQGAGKGVVKVNYMPNVTSDGVIYNTPVHSKTKEMLVDEKARQEMGEIFNVRFEQRENRRYQEELRKAEKADRAAAAAQAAAEKKQKGAAGDESGAAAGGKESGGEEDAGGKEDIKESSAQIVPGQVEGGHNAEPPDSDLSSEGSRSTPSTPSMEREVEMVQVGTSSMDAGAEVVGGSGSGDVVASTKSRRPRGSGRSSRSSCRYTALSSPSDLDLSLERMSDGSSSLSDISGEVEKLFPFDEDGRGPVDITSDDLAQRQHWFRRWLQPIEVWSERFRGLVEVRTGAEKLFTHKSAGPRLSFGTDYEDEGLNENLIVEGAAQNNLELDSPLGAAINFDDPVHFKDHPTKTQDCMMSTLGEEHPLERMFFSEGAHHAAADDVIINSANGPTPAIPERPEEPPPKPKNRAEDAEFRQAKRGEHVARTLPPEATVLKLVGPYGAPAMSMWHFESIILVGAGIGATPFAAMLRSANIKLKQRRVLESNMAGSSGNRSLLNSLPMGAGSVSRVVQEATRVPSMMEFHWIARNRADFDWLFPWLMESVNGPARECTRIHLWITGGGEIMCWGCCRMLRCG